MKTAQVRAKIRVRFDELIWGSLYKRSRIHSEILIAIWDAAQKSVAWRVSRVTDKRLKKRRFFGLTRRLATTIALTATASGLPRKTLRAITQDAVRTVIAEMRDAGVELTADDVLSALSDRAVYA